MKENNNITVIDNRKYNEVKKHLKENLEALNKACDQLRGIDSIFPLDSVKGVKTISSKWLKDYITGVVTSINEDKRLPKDFKQEIKERWQKVYDKAQVLCDKVASIARFEKLTLRKRNGVFMYSPDDVESFAKDEAKVTLSDVQVEYLSLLQELCASLNKVKKYEDTHHWHNISDGVNVPNGKEFAYVDMLRLLSLSSDGERFDVTPEALVQMVDDGVLCVEG